eukprot:TRINITY_DN381_c0_g1_i2.p1 TRINITY_DN381_c0_g1~~TRINITY_DN381_c0_g1_i2.p1  ORF type:complete len:734 (-),score=124.65 TRINITY_DN381_c0_g1_i2:874-3075(-)
MEFRSRMMGCGLMSYQGPPLPKATRSPRVRSSINRGKIVQGKRMAPFELLATVAEDLLQKGELRRSSLEKQASREKIAGDDNDARQALLERQSLYVTKSSDTADMQLSFQLTRKQDPDDQGSSDENAIMNSVAYRMPNHGDSFAEKNQHRLIQHTSQEVMKDVHFENNVDGSATDYGMGCGKRSFSDVDIGEGKGENDVDSNVMDQWNNGSRGRNDNQDYNVLDTYSPPETSVISEESPIVNPPPLVSSDSSVGLLSSDNSHPDSLTCLGNMVDVCRDDDVNSSVCDKLSKRTLKIYTKHKRENFTKEMNVFLLPSKKRLYSDMYYQSNTDRRTSRPSRPKFREGYMYQRSVRSVPCKRKRLLEGKPIPFLGEHTSACNATNSDKNLENVEQMASADNKFTEKLVGSSPASALEYMEDPSRNFSEQDVKVAIKSFSVPEVSLEMRGSATIANLKMAVMDAAMKLLGNGLRICVLLHGEKVDDESSTLGQLGIQEDGKLDSVGFMLEPNTIPTSQMCNEDHPLFVLSEAAASQTSQSIYAADTSGQLNAVQTSKNAVKFHDSTANLNARAEITKESGENMQPQSTSLTTCNVEGTGTSNLQCGTDPRALIFHPTFGSESSQELVSVPLKTKSREAGKRRIRRPFTVAEVEALVHAVEKLGTGRWRDVKLCAFEHAKHRTYVDLKDKWKTLVHTAKIAPHQRRGEPVPQQLLDRVIQAHNYWADHQAKQQREVCL